MNRPPSDETLQSCRRCELWKQATQAVGGEGPRNAAVMLVGEQPGDEEDLRGYPFVGPAGRVLDEAIRAAAMLRKNLFVTNAVKHFKWEPRGKRRLHKRPGAGEIKACHIWLEQELTAINPRVVVALGATALKALTRSSLSIDAARRQALSLENDVPLVATYHPSAILRAEGARAQELKAILIEDLRRAAKLAADIQ
jgi:uracil-DNA glycosylase